MPSTDFTDWHEDIPMSSESESEKAKMFPIMALASPGDSLEFDRIIDAIGGDDSPYNGETAMSKEDTAQQMRKSSLRR